jgi:hypothetical protein
MPLLFLNLPASDWTLKPVFDLRERFERRIDKDFSESSSDNRSDLLSRWRVGVDYSYQNKISGRVMYQYAHNLFWTAAKNGNVPERSDLFLAYLDYSPSKDTKVRLGRQQLVLGSERLLGPSDWGNTGRSFDMVRWTWQNLDIFGGRLAVNGTPSKDAAVAGAFYTSNLGDTLFLYKHDEGGGLQDDIYTLDHNFKYKKDKWSGDLEVAGQMGRTGDKKLEAWAVGSKFNYQATPKWRYYFEAAAASGGGSGDTTRTFDQIYASNHSRYGIMDMQGWRNMTDLSLGVNFKPTKQLSINAEYHKFGLFAADDAWYSDGGRPNSGLKDPTGNSGKDVGQEFDIYASFAPDSKSQFEAGFGVLKPGRFIESFANRGDNQVWGYLQYRLRF